MFEPSRRQKFAFLALMLAVSLVSLSIWRHTKQTNERAGLPPFSFKTLEEFDDKLVKRMRILMSAESYSEDKLPLLFKWLPHIIYQRMNFYSRYSSMWMLCLATLRSRTLSTRQWVGLKRANTLRWLGLNIIKALESKMAVKEDGMFTRQTIRRRPYLTSNLLLWMIHQSKICYPL